MGDEVIRDRLARLAVDADLANADLEVAIIPVVSEEADPASRALLHRFVQLY